MKSLSAAGQEALAIAIEMLEGTAREGQQQMIDEVSQTLEESGRLLVQAGTGTGKSLAYLIPALIFASRNQARVIISTATLALQRQLLTKDIPLAQKAVKKVLRKKPVEVALLKGVNNYLCLHKVYGSYPQDAPALIGEEELAPTGSVGAQIVQLRKFAEETATGDKDDLPLGISEKAWQQLSVPANRCLGDLCPYVGECFSKRARAKAEGAQIVVTNHAILGIEAGGGSNLLGEYDVLILDEAHELPERVRSGASIEISAGSLKRLLRTVKAVCDTANLESAISALETATNELEEGRLRSLPQAVTQGLQLASSAIRKAASQLSESDEDDAEAAQIRLAKNALSEAKTNLLTFLDADGVTQVLWVTRPSRSEDVLLNCAPLDVSEPIATRIFDAPAVIATSATLKLGGSFSPTAHSFGIGGDEDWKGVDVGSPFAYPKQGILYVATDLPHPKASGLSQAALERIGDLATASQGGMLGLFTSRNAFEEAAQYLRENTDLPILVQGEDQLPLLIDQFREDPRACLLGTLSLWQGVDVPGLTSRLVLIDRIPFRPPTDPISSARIEAAARRQQNGFMTVAVSDAALKLAQGAGRLLRSSEDKGVVAILDARLYQKGYGSFLVKSLPQFFPGHSLPEVLAALGRLGSEATEHA